MIATGFESRVQIQQIVESQLPEFILSESPKASEFLKQYYISQEFSGGTVDIVDNLDQYLKLDNLTPEVITGQTTLSESITSSSSIVEVTSTKGFPNQYGLFKIDDEIITYTGITTNTFTGCIRGFSGITSYHADNSPGELVFSTSSASIHSSGKIVYNLSSLFLKEFYKKIKYSLTPGLENVDFVSNLDVSNFIKESKAFYQSKGTEESFRILFNVLYGVNPKVIDLEQYLLKPSASQFIRREIVIAERISGDPNRLVGQTIRKSTDFNTQASVSEVEIISRRGKTYYKLGLFVGFDDRELIEGSFSIPGKTKVIGNVSVGSSVITVDSTIGFSTTGNVVCSGNNITYSNKTINQFLDCVGITSSISSSADIRSDETIYGYEDGDLSKRVDLRITGVLSNFIATSDIKLASEGEKIFVKNLGEKILNPENNKTRKQIFSNSWIYNTSSRYQISTISGSSFTLYSDIDKTSLKETDVVDILVRGTQNIAVSDVVVRNINLTTREILLDNLAGFAPVEGLSYDIRRKLNKAYSSVSDLRYGNNVITSDIQNVYNDNDEYFYVASNSLPSYEITKTISKAILSEANGDRIQGYNAATDTYSILSFDSNVPFITGDSIYYSPESNLIPGLVEGIYYVKVLTNKNQIRLYTSRSFIPIDDYTEFGILPSGSGSHTFTLLNNFGKQIGPQKLLKKFPIISNIESGDGVETTSGPVGILINGVEIYNYKSDDKIYYGPIDKVEILNKGSNYDVINPPTIQISTPGTGTTCLVQPVVSGIVTAVYVDPQDFDIDKVVSVTITGGNGDGSVLEPILKKRYRELPFDARLNTESGGIDITNETITFLNNHNLVNGQSVVYNRNGNDPVSIGTFGGLNSDQNRTLQSGSVYFTEIVNPKTIKLYQTFSDYYVGVNTVGFTTASNLGIHKFRIYDTKTTLDSIKVINPGSGYENRKLIVNTTGISTIESKVNFRSHNFNNGELVTYSTTGTEISGLTTTNQYYVIRLDNDSFRLADAGIDGTISSNYIRKNYIKFESNGSGYHHFEYPQIQVNINVEYSGISGVITATPIVRGSIIDAYVYDGGSGYGSNILNIEKKPTLTIKNGKNAQLKPIVIDGKVISVEIQSIGSEYNASPDLEVIGDGIGAKLRAKVVNGYISEVIILNSGVNYTQDKTSIRVLPPGSGVIIEPKVRGISINNFKRYGSELLVDSNDSLKYSIVGYSTNIGRTYFGDDGVNHSPIIGWAYDGNPIYGPYGYDDPSDQNSGIKLLQTGYTSNLSNINDRPSGFEIGFFVNDYKFTNSGDLDERNGRFCKTPEYPNGIYAYFVGVTTNTTNGRLDPDYPYFVGNQYRSNPIEENFLIDQSTFDFNNSNLIRNTFPYKVSDEYADNDFIVESNEFVDQTSIIDSVTKGSVDSFEIIEPGSDYKIGDSLVFDNEGTNGGGLSASVRTLTGKNITNLQTNIDEYNNVVFTWEGSNRVSAYISTSHTLNDGNGIVVSGFSTSIRSLSSTHIVEVNTERTVLYKEISANPVAGVVTDIYVSSIPNSISVGSSIGIGTEKLLVLNAFTDKNILRVKRGISGSAHTSSTFVDLIPSFLSIPVETEYFDSKINDLYYFNPKQSIGVGTISGVSTSVNFTKGEISEVVSIPSQSIYLPNHPFKTNQQVTFIKPASGFGLTVSNTPNEPTFTIPTSGNSQTLYVISKSKDYIGIVTQVGLTTNTNGLFFVENGSNEFDYLLKSNFSQVTGNIQKITTQVSVSTSHDLLNGDTISLSLNSDNNIGIGTSTSVRVLYNDQYNKLIINPIGFGSESVVSTTNYYAVPTRIGAIDPAVGIAWTSKAITPSATRNAQQIYDYIWDNYNNFDVDGDGVVSSVDGLIIVREMFVANGDANFAGDALISGITFPEGATRTTATAIRSYISSVTGGVGIGSTIGTAPFTSCYDVDGEGLVLPLDDGLMIQRFSTTPGLGAGGFYTFGDLSGYFRIQNHGLKTGDKILYLSNTSSVIKPIDDGEYFSHKIDDDNFQLGLTYQDVTESPVNPVSIAYSGGSNQSISPINPQIQVIKNNNLIFDLKDSSLSGYKFKLYHDSSFKNEFVSTGSTNNFIVSGVGTVGVSTNASLTLNYSSENPIKLFYNLEKSGYISTTDTDVINYSQITYVDSKYTNNYKIFGVGSTTFNISLEEIPESLSYDSTNTSTLKYSTNSTNARGGVDSLQITYGGNGYKKLPNFVSIASTQGFNAKILPISKNISRIENVRIVDPGFEYSSDNTLRPEAFISPSINLLNSSEIVSIDVLYGGKNYISSPDLIVVDPETGIRIDSGLIEANLNGSSISSAQVIQSPKGLSSLEQSIKSINNSNGLSINTIQSSTTGIVTCVLTTPISGFSTSVFSVGDKIFVEGIQKYGTDGDGFNSSDYGYEFFEVSAYRNTNPAEVEFDLSSFSSNVGVAKTFQNSYAIIVKQSDYPIFKATQKSSIFQIGESLLLLNGNEYINIDLSVTESGQNYIKVYGTYQLLSNNIIKGSKSGSIATINTISENSGSFDVNYSLRQDYGWLDNTGKLDEDYQVLPDNDYYQSLSYTVKSPIEFENLVNPVNRLLHTSGLKNFSDTELKSTSSISIGSSSIDTISIFDILEEKRVDTINNYDLSIDLDALNNRSKFLKLKNRKLSGYIECRTNRVLKIDDISSQFSNSLSSLDEYVDLPITEDYSRFLIQIKNPNNSDTQVTELVILKNSNIFTFEKSNIYTTTNQIVDIQGITGAFETYFLRFSPLDPYDSDYDIKIFKNIFNTDLVGISTQSIGFVDLTGVNRIVGVGQSSEIISGDILNINSFFVSAEVTNNSNDEKNFVELYVTHDGTNSYISEYYIDTKLDDLFSSNFIGTFTSYIDSGILSLNYENNSSSAILVRSKIVGFGTTASGIGTYRFKESGQIDGSEKSIKLQSDYTNISIASTIVGFSTDEVTSVKSMVRVSYGETSAIHQIAIVNNGENTYNTQYPFLSIGSTSGIGTFSSEFNGSNFNLVFHPDPSIGAGVDVQSFSEVIYTESDTNNTAPDLSYGSVTESLSLIQFNSINGSRSNKKDFTINYNGIPIFEKKFNPSEASILDQATGIFTIGDHFFNTGERLIYTPTSTFVGIAASAVGIGATLNSVGVVTTILPSEVYAIRINKDKFRLSTRKDYASSGIYVTFTDSGSGNSHRLEMYKKLEKSLIDIDGIIQSPLSFTPLSTTLNDNGGQITNSSTIFGVSGISTIVPNNIVKIDDEYMKVVSVGFGTTSVGPISGTGSVPILEVERASVGSAATSHTDGTEVRVYSGSFNIVGSKIYFTDAPKGKPTFLKDFSNLEYTRSSFDGRVYLRNDYTNNRIFDDISDRFTGIGQTYNVTVQGINTTGIQTGSGILLINGIFQKPSTFNNIGNNYSYIESVGVSSIVFTGITSSNGSIIKSDFDINQNQLPRGGVIVSLGSSGGLGIAPLVGASVTAVVGAGGSIVSVGLGTTDTLGSGYDGLVSIGISVYENGHIGDVATINASVGVGGTLSFTIGAAGTGYINPSIFVSEPSYQNLQVTGVSRLGVGSTTDTGNNLLISVDVGASSTTGIGSTLFEVTSFEIARPGYGFKVGDVFTPVGLVTDKNLPSPLSNFELTVLDVFTDSMTSWEFGEFDFIDPIDSLQDGFRTRFPLYYNANLLSFEINSNDPDSSLIDLNSLLLIFVNGVLQTPGESYNFEGGTSFSFITPPDPEDNISIFFYKGTSQSDSVTVSVKESIKVGDLLQVHKNNNYPETITQDIGTIYDISTSDKIETELYSGEGIDEINFKPLSWTKQKVDKVINGQNIYKSRDSIESLVYPTAKIIKNLSSSATELFVDDAQFFNYEENNSVLVISSVGGLIVTGDSPVAAGLTAVVSVGGTIQSLSIVSSGSGYVGSAITVSISAPHAVGVGVGTTAAATATITNGQVTSITIVNPGFGYSQNNPPQVLAPLPTFSKEDVNNITTVEGFSGIITGITTTTGTSGNPLALKLYINSTSFVGLETGYPLYIFNTSVGSGVTSIDENNSAVVGIGTTFLDNIYYIHSITSSGSNSEIVSNVHSSSNIIGIDTSGSTSQPIGRFSWGRLSGFNRSSNPISLGVTGFTIDAGLSTFPSIQRRDYGLRDTGALRKDLG